MFLTKGFRLFSFGVLDLVCDQENSHESKNSLVSNVFNHNIVSVSQTSKYGKLYQSNVTPNKWNAKQSRYFECFATSGESAW